MSCPKQVYFIHDTETHSKQRGVYKLKKKFTEDIKSLFSDKWADLHIHSTLKIWNNIELYVSGRSSK